MEFISFITENINGIGSILTVINDESKSQSTALEEIVATLGSSDKTDLITEIQTMRSEQNDFSVTTQQNVEFIVASMKENREYIAEKFKEFADLLAKSNTEKLVEAMKTATEQFNAQMKELIDRLIKENFDELNKSVERMNEWQQENKEMIKTLTEQFRTVSQNLTLSAQSIKEITQNTDKLTNDNSMLKRLIEELQKVMIEDKKFSAIATQLEKAVSNTENATIKLQEWIKDEKHFSESVKALLNKLEDVEKIKDINEIFWQNLKEQLEKGVGMIESANRNISEGIRNNLQALDNSFESRLETTFQNLDKLIARALQYYHGERSNK
jgi:DNA repair exonuclease SbcCD ATPase subunit